jgi:hypothetical protein
LKDLAKKAAKRKQIEDQFGPLNFVLPGDADQVRELNPAFVWTLRSPENDSILTNGFFETDDLDGFYQAARPCLEPFGTIFAFDVISIDCEDCNEGQDAVCQSCLGEQLLFIDLQEVILRKEIDLQSDDAIWSQRVPGGTFGEICVPADYLNTEHSRSLPRPYWVSL